MLSVKVGGENKIRILCDLKYFKLNYIYDFLLVLQILLFHKPLLCFEETL